MSRICSNGQSETTQLRSPVAARVMLGMAGLRSFGIFPSVCLALPPTFTLTIASSLLGRRQAEVMAVGSKNIDGYLWMIRVILLCPNLGLVS